MSKSISEAAALHKEDVARLAHNGGYKCAYAASTYIERHLSDVWRPVLGIDDYGTGLVKQLRLSETMALVIALFGRAVHRHKMERSKLPIVSRWTPVVDKQSGLIRYPRAISKNDIAKVIGKSRSAVDEAVAALRGKGDKYAPLTERKIAFPMYVDTGIMLDVMTTQNLSFAFMFEEYVYAKRVAEDARLNDATTNQKQRDWCTEAGATQTLPKQDKANDHQSAAGGI